MRLKKMDKIILTVLVIFIILIIYSSVRAGQVIVYPGDSTLPITISESSHSGEYGGVGHSRDTLTMDGVYLQSVDSGFIFSTTYNWYFDMGGDTIAFCSTATAAGRRARGILIHGACSSIVINKAVVISKAQGIDTTIVWSGSAPTSANADDTLTGRIIGISVTGYQCHDITIDSCYVEINNYSSQCIWLGGHGNHLVQNTTVRSNSCGFKSRGTYDGAVIKATGFDSTRITGDGYNYHFRLYNVTCERGPYSAIAASAAATENWYRTEIEACTLNIDAWNIMWPDGAGGVENGTANAYGIHLLSVGRGYIKDCKITSGTAHKGGRGILFEVAHGTALDSIEISGNYINTHEGACVEFGSQYGYFPCGIKIRYRCTGLYIYNNTVIYTANGDVAYGTVGQNSNSYYLYGHAIVYEINQAVVSQPDWITIRNNIFRVVDSGSGAYMEAVLFDDVQQSQIDTSFHWENNRVESDSIGYRWGGYDGFASYVKIIEDTLRLVDTSSSGHVTYQLGHLLNNWATHDIFMEDIIYEDSAGNPLNADTNIIFPSSGGEADITLRKTLNFYIIDSSNNPLENAVIVIQNHYDSTGNDTTAIDTSDANGLASAMLDYIFESRGATDSTFSDFKIKYSKNGVDTLKRYTVNWNTDIDTVKIMTDGGAAGSVSGVHLKGLKIIGGKF